MIALKSKPKKISFANIQENMTDWEKKTIMAGSSCYGDAEWQWGQDSLLMAQNSQSNANVYAISTGGSNGNPASTYMISTAAWNPPPIWTETANGYSTTDPAIIAQVINAYNTQYGYDPNNVWNPNLGGPGIGGYEMGGITIYKVKTQIDANNITNYEPLLRFIADSTEKFGSSMELLSLVGAVFTEGVTIPGAIIGADIGLAGTTLNSVLDIYYDQNANMAIARLLSYGATFGLGKAIESARASGATSAVDTVILNWINYTFGEGVSNNLEGKYETN